MFYWDLLQQAEQWGVVIGEKEQQLFARYLRLLYDFNRQMNLTRVPESQAVGRHLVDSLALLAVENPPVGARVLDVGTGAGFPGIPLKIVRPDLHLTLLDSHGKSIAFLQGVCQALPLSGIRCVQARAEEWAHRPEAREQFDRVVARAVAKMPILMELLLPFVRVGGIGLALKSEEESAEVEAVQEVAPLLGATCSFQAVELRMETGQVKRLIILLHKVSPTPEAYPRRWARMRREPLGGNR